MKENEHIEHWMDRHCHGVGVNLSRGCAYYTCVLFCPRCKIWGVFQDRELFAECKDAGSAARHYCEIAEFC